jgi:hypothetical protein
VLGPALSLLLALGPGFDGDVGAAEDGRRFAPPALEFGYGIRESWDDLWRRFLDREGRPDPRGPLLQPGPELQRAEYELTLAVAEHPLQFERDWQQRTRGARVFIHSDDEFSFFNEVRAKERIPMGKVAALGLRYDRLELREVRSSMFQLAFAFPDIRGTGAFVEVRPVARFEKPDLDLELAVGWTRPEQGKVQLRVFSLDTFANASEALAAGRGSAEPLRVIQRAPLFGLSAEAEVYAFERLRAALYLGGIIPARQDFLYGSETALVDRQREQAAALAGAWVEWRVPRSPLLLGASATTVHTRQLDRDFDGAVLGWVREHETRARLYALARIDDAIIPKFLGSLTVELSGSHRRTWLPEHGARPLEAAVSAATPPADSGHLTPPAPPGSLPFDRSWLGLLRATWMPTRVFGLELAYLVLDRDNLGDGDLAVYLSATNNRLSTRFALAFDPHVWITFGVGWDLDRGDGVYDQGGMTLTGRW